MEALTQFLQWVLFAIHGVCPDWGWSVVALTMLVRATLGVALWPLQRRLRQQKVALEALAPEIQKIKVRFKEDMLGQMRAIRELKRARGLAGSDGLGALATFVSLPLLLAMYRVVTHTPELLTAHFLWIPQLGHADSTLVLPLIFMALSFFQARLQTAPSLSQLFRGSQGKVAANDAGSSPGKKDQFNPGLALGTTKGAAVSALFMGLMMFRLPAGVVLYSAAGGLVQIGFDLVRLI